MILWEEFDLAPCNIYKPAVMREAGDTGLMSTACLPKAGWHLNVTCLSDTRHFGADPQRIANILKSMRADNKVDGFIRERIRRLIANIALNPRIPRKVLHPPPDFRYGIMPSESAIIKTASLVRLRIHDVIRTIEGMRPSSNIEY